MSSPFSPLQLIQNLPTVRLLRTHFLQNIPFLKKSGLSFSRELREQIFFGLLNHLSQMIDTFSLLAPSFHHHQLVSYYTLLPHPLSFFWVSSLALKLNKFNLLIQKYLIDIVNIVIY